MKISLYHPVYARLRETLVGLRKAARLNQADVARSLGVGQTYISKLECGENYVDVVQFAQWCEACGTDAGDTLNTILKEAHFRPNPVTDKTEP